MHIPVVTPVHACNCVDDVGFMTAYSASLYLYFIQSRHRYVALLTSAQGTTKSKSKFATISLYAQVSMANFELCQFCQDKQSIHGIQIKSIDYESI